MKRLVSLSMVSISLIAQWPAFLAAQESRPSSQSKPTDPSDKQEQPFVDRDGDGIRDGEERRFRRRHRGKDRTQDTERRRRLREGQGDPGKGVPGPHGGR
jgi:hypothetical protein